MRRLARHVKWVSKMVIGTPSRVVADKQAKKVFTSFGAKRKLVYFNAIERSRNDAYIVRGLTLGISSGDTQHLIGTHHGYDVAAVLRQGEQRSGREWIVMQFDLHTAVGLPHILLGKKKDVQPIFESLLGIHRALQEHLPAEPHKHHHKFAKHFIMYAPPAHAPLVDYIVSPDLTNALVDHVQDIVIEIEGDSIYLCVENPALSVHFLDKMMHYGIQFAKHIDTRMGAA